MAKGDKEKVQTTVDDQSKNAQSGIDQLRTNNQNLSNQFQSLYTPATATNNKNYGDVMNGYQEFLRNQPNSGALLSGFLGTNRTNTALPSGATATGPAGSTAASVDQSLYAPTGDKNRDAVLALYKKYGKTPGESGSGLTDTAYWSGDAMRNANGDSDYVLKRLEDDLQGHGMDSGSSSSSSSSSSGGSPFDMSALAPAISKFSEFAKTGGFSPDDISNIRARAVAPIRSIADNARQQIQRQASIRGAGYSPNTTAALAKTARDEEYAAGDTSTNAEAAIAGLKNQGMLAGAGGLSTIGLGGRGQDLSQFLGLRGQDFGQAMGMRGQDLSAILGGGQQSLGGLAGMTGLYGTTPGLSNMFGNQVLGAGAQGINIGGLQNSLMGNTINGQLGVATTPSNFQNVLGNVGQVANIAGNVATAFA